MHLLDNGSISGSMSLIFWVSAYGWEDNRVQIVRAVCVSFCLMCKWRFLSSRFMGLLYVFLSKLEHKFSAAAVVPFVSSWLSTLVSCCRARICRMVCTGVRRVAASVYRVQ